MRAATVPIVVLCILGASCAPLHDFGKSPDDPKRIAWKIDYTCTAPKFTDLKALNPANTVVVDEKAAIHIAQPIFHRIFGKEDIDRTLPLVARNYEDKWLVEGTLPDGMVGGVAMMVISKKTGEVLCLTHGQ